MTQVVPTSAQPGFHAHLCEGREGAVLGSADDESKRMRAKLKAVHDQLKRRRHQPIPEQGRWLASVLRGHFAYYAVPGNDAPASFLDQVTRRWLRALRRRSQQTGSPGSGWSASPPDGYRRPA